jgi:hypothetical protein
VTALLATVTLLLAATPAAPATGPVYSGKGWKAETSNFHIYSINPGPYTVVFATSAARTKLAPYLKTLASQTTTITGIQVTVTTTLDSTSTAVCPAWNRIVVHYKHRPTGTAGMSRALPCHGADGSARGGHVLMDSEYWTVAHWFSRNATVNESYRKDAVAHELGHIFGLDHPNTDLNRNGTVGAGECVKNSQGVKPVMCSPNRGPVPATAGGKYTAEFDAVGLKQLARNWYLRLT